jgi:hypothetical protein
MGVSPRVRWERDGERGVVGRPKWHKCPLAGPLAARPEFTRSFSAVFPREGIRGPKYHTKPSKSG